MVNGVLCSTPQQAISITDRGLTLGVGLFETMKVEASQPIAFEHHWARLVNSARLLNISLPFLKRELIAQLQSLIEQNNLSDGGVRLTLTDGEALRGIVVKEKGPANYFITTFTVASRAVPKSACLVSIRRNEQSLSSRVKSISYLDNVLAKEEATAKGFDEAILLNSKGMVSEGATTNVFVLKNEVLYTPPIADGALPGVMRERLLEGGVSKFPIKIESFDSEFLLGAEQVFLSNALIGLQPLLKLES